MGIKSEFMRADECFDELLIDASWGNKETSPTSVVWDTVYSKKHSQLKFSWDKRTQRNKMLF